MCIYHDLPILSGERTNGNYIGWWWMMVLPQSDWPWPYWSTKSLALLPISPSRIVLRNPNHGTLCMGWKPNMFSNINPTLTQLWLVENCGSMGLFIFSFTFLGVQFCCVLHAFTTAKSPFTSTAPVSSVGSHDAEPNGYKAQTIGISWATMKIQSHHSLTWFFLSCYNIYHFQWVNPL